jgi:nicotinate-nucleotide--dimethylbenzimidazole phosphoribosyltransferase
MAEITTPTPDERARAAARELQARLTKPAGALGRLEDLHVWAAGVLRDASPPPLRNVIVVAAGDHGVAAHGVSAYPSSVTAQMVRNMLDGGAAINALAAGHAGVIVVDAGVACAIDDARLRVEKVRAGTEDMTHGPAMSRSDAVSLVERGVACAREIAAGTPAAVGLGDMGIGNTTAAAAITSLICGVPARTTAGRGTGIDDVRLRTKIAAIERAIAVNEPDPRDPLDVLAKVGGCEIAFLAGVALGAAASSSPVVLDGFPTTAAALIATTIEPVVGEYLFASHVGAEPGHRIALEHLGVQPLLDLGLRLGEGSGAVLAMTLLDAALRVPRDMATFDSAGVDRATAETRPEA